MQLERFCKNCSGSHCIATAEPDWQKPEAACPTCDGRGCDDCQGGWFTVEGCPSRYVGEMWQVITMAELMDKGLLPDPGGLLDQCHWFIEAAKWYKNDQAIAKTEELKRR